jgi:hypothetical protein
MWEVSMEGSHNLIGSRARDLSASRITYREYSKMLTKPVVISRNEAWTWGTTTSDTKYNLYDLELYVLCAKR